MNSFEAKDVCEVSEPEDVSPFRDFLNADPSGICVVSETYGSDGSRVLRPDAGDFVKWVRSTQPNIRVEVQHAPRLVLHSNDVWLPLVFLAQDVGLPVYLNLVSSYLYNRFKNALRSDRPRVHLSAEYIDTKSGAIRRFKFEGDHEALRATIKKFDLNEFMNA